MRGPPTWRPGAHPSPGGLFALLRWAWGHSVCPRVPRAPPPPHTLVQACQAHTNVTTTPPRPAPPLSDTLLAVPHPLPPSLLDSSFAAALSEAPSESEATFIASREGRRFLPLLALKCQQGLPLLGSSPFLPLPSPLLTHHPHHHHHYHRK